LHKVGFIAKLRLVLNFVELRVSNLSLPLLLAWDIAANEAAQSRRKLIEPEHLFIGLCKLEDFSTTTALIELGYDQNDSSLMKTEIVNFVDMLYRFSLNPANLRKEARQRRNTGVLSLLNGWTTGMLRPPESDSNVIHRSPASREAFARAEEFARLAGSPLITTFHLLAALLTDEAFRLTTWLKVYVDVNELREAALNAPLPNNK
jgi:ATP-dependent Clp protease ATP-binding subunit ClpA